MAPEQERVALQEELERLEKRKEVLRARQLRRYDDGTASRAKVTTHNKDVDLIQEQCVEIRARLKELAA